MINWKECSEFVKTKTERQCYDHYNLQRGKVSTKQYSRHKWTKDEEDRLMRFDLKMYSWEEFQAEKFPGFSLSQLKNKH